MDKFINAFSRTPHRKDDEGRSHHFAKRLASSTSTPFIADKPPGPILSSSELSPMEADVYGAWWDKLDPFGLGVVVDKSMHSFLIASNVDPDILQQIIDFYAGEAHYLEDQFYAILRLVAHGQSGRKVNRDLVVLGAPLATFKHGVLDSLSNQETSTIQTTSTSNDNRSNARNTWWGQSLSTQKDTPGTSLFGTSETHHQPQPQPQNQQQQQQHQQQQQQQQPFPLSSTSNQRHSYAGSTLSSSAFLSPTHPPPPMPTFNVSETQCQPPSWAATPHNDKGTLTSSNTPMIPASQYTTPHQTNAFAWAEQALVSSAATTTTDQHPQHPFKSSGESSVTSASTGSKSIYTHSRSRSVPYASQDMSSANDFIFDTLTATQSKQEQPRPVLVTSRSSMDATAFHRLSQQEQQHIDHGQALLLTQKFVPPSSTTRSTNPFEDDDDDDASNNNIDNDNDEGDDIGAQPDNDVDLTITADQQSNQPPQKHGITKSPFDDSSPVGSSSGFSAKATPTITATPNFLDRPIPAATRSNTQPTSPRVTRTTTDIGKFAFPTRAQEVNQRSNKLNIAPPPVPPQSSKPDYPRYVRNQPLKRSQSQHSGQRHLQQQQQQQPFMSQGAFLLATTSAASSVQFPTVPPPPASSTTPFDDTTRLFRHRSTTSFPHK